MEVWDGETVQRATERGAERKEQLIAEAGGLLSSKTAAAMLRISPQALARMTERGQLIAVKHARSELAYPVFQFESKDMLVGIAAVLKVIGVEDPWMRFNFLFLKLTELGESRPIDVIRAGNAPHAAAAARHYGNHGAL